MLFYAENDCIYEDSPIAVRLHTKKPIPIKYD